MPPKKDDKGGKKPQTKKVEANKASSSKNPQSRGANSKDENVKPSRDVVDRNTVKLFEAAKRGQTKNIHEFIRLGADVNGRDEEGRTPIIRAAELRNNTVQSLLMNTDIDVNAADKLGRTALHFESAQGDIESVKQLLAHGASVDKRDLGGRTPLHYASLKKHVAVADILVFCGADGSVKDMKGFSPESVCETDAMWKVMERSQEITYAIKQEYIAITRTALRPKTKTNLASIGLTVTTPDGFYTPDRPKGWSTKREDFEKLLDTHVCFLCQRVRPEYSHSSLGPVQRRKELLISDTFEFRLSGAYQGKSIVQMAVPIYTRPEPYEELHIKTNKEPDLGEFSEELLDYEREENSNQWQCRVEIDLREINCFVLVTRPRVEHFKVGSKGGRFTSEVDDYIKIDVPEKSFSDKGDVTLELVPRPAYTNDELPIKTIKVTSVSNFYELNHSKEEQPQNDVTMTLPLPRDYNGEDTSLYVLSRRKPEQNESEISLWEIVNINPKLTNGRTSFKLSHFSSEVLIEAENTNKLDKFKDSENQISRNSMPSKSTKTDNTTSWDGLKRQEKSNDKSIKNVTSSQGKETTKGQQQNEENSMRKVSKESQASSTAKPMSGRGMVKTSEAKSNRDHFQTMGSKNSLSSSSSKKHSKNAVEEKQKQVNKDEVNDKSEKPKAGSQKGYKGSLVSLSSKEGQERDVNEVKRTECVDKDQDDEKKEDKELISERRASNGSLKSLASRNSRMSTAVGDDNTVEKSDDWNIVKSNVRTTDDVSEEKKSDDVAVSDDVKDVKTSDDSNEVKQSDDIDATKVEKSDDDVGDGKKSDDDVGDGKKSDDDVGDGKKSDDDVGDGKKSDDDVGDGKKSDGDVGDGKKSVDDVGDGKKSDGDVGDGKKSVDDVGDGKKSDGDVGDGKKSDGDVGDGKKSDGDVVDGKKSDGDVGDGKKSEDVKISGDMKKSDDTSKPDLGVDQIQTEDLTVDENYEKAKMDETSRRQLDEDIISVTSESKIVKENLNQQMKRGSVSSFKGSQYSLKSHRSDRSKPSKEKSLSRIAEREIKTAAALLYKKACERKCKVSFVVMLKTMADSSYETLAECTTMEPEKRIDFWKMEGFEDQKPSHPKPNEFEVIPKTEFEFEITGPVESILKQKLEFHPKRKGDNFTRFAVSRKKKGESEAELQIVSKTDKKSLGYVVMHLDGVSREGLRLDNAKKDPGFKGFTNDAFLEDVAKELKDDWFQLGIKLGFARSQLNKLQKKDNFKLKMLISWRNNCRYREDLGVRLLATGLKQIERMDILEEVVEKKLDSWLQKKSNKEDSFTKWLTVARSREWEIPKGSLRPLSDGFLMALVDQVGLCMQLIHQLGVPSSVAHDVENDRIFFRKPERQMLELLGQAKKRCSTDIEFYKLLDETLGDLEQNDTKEWMRNVTAEWCDTQTDTDGDALLQQLTSYLEEVEQEEEYYHKQQENMRDEEASNEGETIQESHKYEEGELIEGNETNDKGGVFSETGVNNEGEAIEGMEKSEKGELTVDTDVNNKGETIEVTEKTEGGTEINNKEEGEDSMK